MNAKASSEAGPASFLPEKLRKKLNYWFVQYNPLYFFSALCVLFGVFLISKGLPELDWRKGQSLLTAVMQFYEILLIAGAALLVRMAGQYRPAVILALIEIFFIFSICLCGSKCSGSLFSRPRPRHFSFCGFWPRRTSGHGLVDC